MGCTCCGGAPGWPCKAVDGDIAWCEAMIWRLTGLGSWQPAAGPRAALGSVVLGLDKKAPCRYCRRHLSDGIHATWGSDGTMQDVQGQREMGLRYESRSTQLYLFGEDAGGERSILPRQ